MASATERHPYAVRFIVGSEGAERFSFYGMRSILTIYKDRNERGRDIAIRLELFDEATARQRERERVTQHVSGTSRGWTREDLYERRLSARDSHDRRSPADARAT
jgi:hypothetical protein